MKKMRKAVTLLLVATLSATLFTGVQEAAFAESDKWDGTSKDTSWDGTGTSNDPYLITSAAELAGLSEMMHYKGSGYYNEFFRLTTDIDLDNKPFAPIGNKHDSADEPFCGSFDGDGHVIKNLRFTNSGEDIPGANAPRYGLFGSTYEGKISNLGIETMSVSVKNNWGAHAGALIGSTSNTVIENCYAEDTNVTSFATNEQQHSGGLVGSLSGGSVSNCYVRYVKINITQDNKYASYAGSFIGRVNNAVISNSYSADFKELYGKTKAFIGNADGSTVTNCYYATGSVLTEAGDNYTATKTDSYATALTSAELSDYAETLGTAFKSDIYHSYAGYPILAWQEPLVGYYQITSQVSAGGTVVFESTQTAEIEDKEYFHAGAVVTLKISTDENVIVDSVSCDGTTIDPKDGVYSFTMPEKDTEVIVKFITSAEVLKVIGDINTCKDTQDSIGIKEIFANNEKVIRILSGELFELVSKEQSTVDAFFEQLATMDKTDTTTNSAIDDFSEQMENVALLVLIKNSNDTSNTKELLDKANNKKAMKGYSTFLMLENKQDDILTQLPTKDFKTCDELADFIFLSSIKIGFENAISPGSVKSILTQNKDYLDGIENELARCEKLENPDWAYGKLCGKEFSDLSEIKKAFAQAIDDVKKDEEDSKSGGSSRGSSGGSSGGSSRGSSKTYVTAPVQVIEPTTVLPSVNTIAFKDLQNVPWAEQAIERFAQLGYVSGDGNKMFYPNKEITREEFTKIFVLATGIHYDNAEIDFSDVSTADWFYSYVADAVKAKIIGGVGNGRFGTGEKITRQDMAVMLYRYLPLPATATEKFSDDEYIADYAKDAVNCMREYGVFTGMENNTFVPRGNLTKAQAVIAIDRLLNIKENVR